MNSDLHWRLVSLIGMEDQVYSRFENNMFRQNDRSVEVNTIVVGSFGFCELIRQINADEVFCFSDDYPSVNLLAYAMKNIESSSYDSIIIENMPHYWTNNWSADRRTVGGAPKENFWRLFQSHSHQFSLCKQHTKIFFEWLTTIFNKFLTPTKAQTVKPINMLHLKWADYPEDRHPYVKSMRRKFESLKAIWIYSAINYEIENMSAEIKARYDENFIRSSEFELGRNMSLMEFKDAQ